MAVGCYLRNVMEAGDKQARPNAAVLVCLGQVSTGEVSPLATWCWHWYWRCSIAQVLRIALSDASALKLAACDSRAVECQPAGPCVAPAPAREPARMLPA